MNKILCIRFSLNITKMITIYVYTNNQLENIKEYLKLNNR